MHRIVLTAAAAFLAGGVLTGAMLSYAQPAPPPAGGPMEQAGGPGGGPGGPGGHFWMRHPGMHHGPFAGGPVHGLRALALVYRQQDRALTPPDVQKIAEAFLLWNGNHTWKVVDTAATPDGLIAFSLATGQGSVIAKFTMDPHTARLVRVG